MGGLDEWEKLLRIMAFKHERAKRYRVILKSYIRLIWLERDARIFNPGKGMNDNQLYDYMLYEVSKVLRDANIPCNLGIELDFCESVLF